MSKIASEKYFAIYFISKNDDHVVHHLSIYLQKNEDNHHQNHVLFSAVYFRALIMGEVRWGLFS